MPHRRIDCTADLEATADRGGLCTTLAATLVALRHDDGAPLFPLAGTRMRAWPAPHFAVADGQSDRAFIYLNLLITPGRSPAMVQRAGVKAVGFMPKDPENGSLRNPMDNAIQIIAAHAR